MGESADNRLPSAKRRTIEEFRKVLAEPREYSSDGLREEKAEFVKGLYNRFIHTIMSYDGSFIDGHFKNRMIAHNADYADFVLTAEDDSEHAKVYEETLKLLLEPGYSPPKAEWRDDILTHMECLLIFYSFIDQDIPTKAFSHLDFAMAKITNEAMKYIDTLVSEGIREIERTRKSTASIKRKKNENEQNVLEAYFRIDTKDKSFHRIARDIKDYLQGKKINISITTIKRILERDGKRDIHM